MHRHKLMQRVSCRDYHVEKYVLTNSRDIRLYSDVVRRDEQHKQGLCMPLQLVQILDKLSDCRHFWFMRTKHHV